MAKRKPVFSMHLEVGTFFCKTAFVTPLEVDHLLSTSLNREKTPKNHKFSLNVPSARHVPRVAHQVTRHTLARAFLYTSVFVACQSDLW